MNPVVDDFCPLNWESQTEDPWFTLYHHGEDGEDEVPPVTTMSKVVMIRGDEQVGRVGEVLFTSIKGGHVYLFLRLFS